MVLKPGNEQRFLEIFAERKDRIAGFPGCERVELLQAKNTFFTYSVWTHPNALENYRNSPLFQETWTLVKPLFSQKAEAWSAELQF
ncbi:MAG: antibiotic biosynthesis monooxygenase family protein [Chitinophagales bacterium]